MLKELQVAGIFLAIGLLLGFFISGQKIERIHDLPAEPQTMRVFEDGSFVGCIKGGLCND